MTDELMTTAMIKAELSVSYGTVINWLNSGVLPGFKIRPCRKGGGRWRLRREDFNAYLRDRREDGSASDHAA